MTKKTIILTESDFQALKKNGSIEVVPVPAQNADDIGFARSEVESVTVRASAANGRKIMITRTVESIVSVNGSARYFQSDYYPE